MPIEREGDDVMALGNGKTNNQPRIDLYNRPSRKWRRILAMTSSPMLHETSPTSAGSKLLPPSRRRLYTPGS